MRKLLASRPSPAMAVAFVALLAALSGTAIALPGTNSVDSGDIKNNSVKSKDVRNNNLRGKDVRNSSLTGKDVKDNSLTGADINESTLGTVPSANNSATAGNANALGGQPPSAFEPSGRTQRFVKLLNEDQTSVVASTADFDVVAVCDDDASLTSFNNEGTAIYIVQKGDNNGVARSYDDNDQDFDVGDFIGFDFEDTDDGGAAVNPNGHSILVHGGVVVDAGTSDGTTTGAPGFSNDCVFNGFLEIIS